MARRSGISGVSKLRKTLRRMDPAATEQLRGVVRDGLEAIKLDAITFVPKDEGDLARSIDYKLGRDGLTGVVGPGAKAAEIVRKKTGSPFGIASGKVRLSKSNRALIYQYYKGYWIEFGTKGSPSHNVPPQPARPFMGPAWDVNRAWFTRRARKALRLTLERASRG